MNGPRERRRRARRRGKALMLSVLLVALVLVSSMTMRIIPEPGKQAKPTRSELGYARNIFQLNGYNGEALVYLERWPEFVPYLTGEVDDPALCGPVAD